MHTALLVPVMILGLSTLVVIHELGHYLVARAFGMRVLTFSIGFGPVIWRWRPKGSETVFQIAALPLLAYVQIAGMNPREQRNPTDRGSYQNASVLARVFTIAAGPLANYLAACACFVVLALSGESIPVIDRPEVAHVSANSAAAVAGMHDNDLLRSINGTPIERWEQVLTMVRGSQGHTLELVVERQGGVRVPLSVTPRLSQRDNRYLLGVEARVRYRPATPSEAVRLALVMPAEATVAIAEQLGAMATRRAPLALVSPIGIVDQAVQHARSGWRDGLDVLTNISLNLFFFNLLPIPALDGGRLMLLGYELLLRRKPNPRVEARMLSWSMIFMLGLFVIVMGKDLVVMIGRLF